MRVVAVLLRWRLRVALGMVRERDWARLAVAAAFVVVFTGVGIGAYIFFTRSFRAIAALGVAGPPLTLFALEAFFVLILVVGMLSAVATGSTLFFRVAENRLLLSAPVPLHALFVLRAIETFLLTSWAFGLLALPALLALGVTFNRAAGFYVVGAGLLLGFLVFAGGIGTLLTMVLGTLLGHFRSRLGIIGVSTALLLVAAGLVGRTVIPNRADLMTMFEPGTLNGTTIALHFVEEKFRGWPSHAFAASIFGLATGQGSRPRHVFAWSAILPALVVAGTYWTGAILFGRAVRTAAEGVLVARPQGEAGPRRGFKIYPVRLRGATGALLEKEFLTLVRTPQELGRGAFLAFLLLLYTLFFLRVPVPGEAGTEDVLARLCAFSLLAAGYFLTTLALRFVFPALSLEGRAAWILFATPLRLGALFRVRLALYSLAGFVGLGSISAVGALRLGLGGAGLAGFVVLLLLMSVTVMTVALALGLCWPDFRGRSAEALATSGGGLLTTAVCLGYVAITGWLGYRLV
ncbi:MAG: putative ABC transporter permease subunit, partial [Candidatus Rokuibacteriota bacterium]